jgi:hypothetical protein
MIVVRRALCCLLILAFAAPMWSKSLYFESKHETIRVRMIAQEPSAPTSATTRNTDWYIVELQNKSGEKQFVRLTYSFLYFEPRLPESFLDYSAVHKFRAVRDRSCDLPVARLDKRHLQPVRNAPDADLDRNDALPCYVVTPKDYKGTKRAGRAERVLRD